MLKNNPKTLIVVAGPTAIGKSALAILLAGHLGTEIISADSRQIYSGIPVVTAAPSEEELQQVPHSFIGTLPLEEYFSASLFEQEALKKLDLIFEKHDTAIVAGGSMMYVDALCNGIDDIPTVPDDLRHEVVEMHRSQGDEAMRLMLRNLDPEYYRVVDLRNMKRVIHAIEICLASGTTYTALRTGKKQTRPFSIIKIGLNAPREVLFSRINKRVEIMVESGLEAEARRVLPYRHLNSLNTVGLKEMFAYIDGEYDLNEAIRRIQRNTRVYAKKQLTWLKRDADIKWFDITSPGFPEDVINFVDCEISSAKDLCATSC